MERWRGRGERVERDLEMPTKRLASARARPTSRPHTNTACADSKHPRHSQNTPVTSIEFTRIRSVSRHSRPTPDTPRNSSSDRYKSNYRWIRAACDNPFVVCDTAAATLSYTCCCTHLLQHLPCLSQTRRMCSQLPPKAFHFTCYPVATVCARPIRIAPVSLYTPAPGHQPLVSRLLQSIHFFTTSPIAASPCLLQSAPLSPPEI